MSTVFRNILVIGAEMGNIHKKYIMYNIQILTDFCSKYTIYIYFENFGKHTIYNILLSQKVYSIYFQNILKKLYTITVNINRIF